MNLFCLACKSAHFGFEGSLFEASDVVATHFVDGPEEVSAARRYYGKVYQIPYIVLWMASGMKVAFTHPEQVGKLARFFEKRAEA